MNVIATVLLVLWLACGVYGALANIERIQRIWGGRNPLDVIQHLATIVTGPIGIWSVMACGGRFTFWKKQ